MKKIILIGLLLLPGSMTWAEGHNDSLLNESNCEEMKQGIGEVMGIADYLFKEIEKNNAKDQPENERKAAEQDLYVAAGFMSQQAANYSIMYDVWCD
jgi:hypothetical protein